MKSGTLQNKTGIVARTHVGMVRQNNEDFHGYSVNISEKDWHFYEESVIDIDNQPILLVVADGMGGLEMGEEASRIAVETSRDFAFENAEKLMNADSGKLKGFFNELFININNNILDFAKKNAKEGEIGTTLIMSFIYNKQAHVYWIGDSRCYMFRQGKLKPVSKDHSYVQELVDQGRITYEQAFFHPESNIITKFMGDPKTNPVPSYTSVNLEEGDVMLLCSDGLNAMLQDSIIEKHFYGSDDLSSVCQSLIDDANSEGGHDNNTLILASFGDFAKTRPAEMPVYANTEKPNHSVNEQNVEVKTEYKIIYKLKWKAAFLFFILGVVIALAGAYAYDSLFKSKSVDEQTEVLNEDEINGEEENNKISNNEQNINKKKPNTDESSVNPDNNTNTSENNDTPDNSGLIKIEDYPSIVDLLQKIVKLYERADAEEYPEKESVINSCKKAMTHTPSGSDQTGYRDKNQLKTVLDNIVKAIPDAASGALGAYKKQLKSAIDKI